ncbi:MAG: tRNA (adenosine(37)-N6)-threonylcarbamoyltransferase complex dimerization subunit type 1 TsaB [Candidatus Xenobia bacterium]
MSAFAIECCTETTSVALCVPGPGGFTVWARRHHHKGAQLRELVPLCQELMQASGQFSTDVTVVAVTHGPGTFTGVRIGVATARTLAQAWNVPLLGLSTLDTLALNVRGYRLPDPAWNVTVAAEREAPSVLALLDARKGEVFGAFYPAGPRAAWPQPQVGPLACRPEEVAHRFPRAEAVLGSGVLYYPQLGPEAGDPWPHAAHLALAGAGAYGDLKAGPWHTVEPFYLRAPDAAIPEFMRQQVQL